MEEENLDEFVRGRALLVPPGCLRRGYWFSLLRLRVGNLQAFATALEGVRVGVRLRLCGQGLRLALRASGARVHCRARLCAASFLWARFALASLWFWSSCSLPYVTSMVGPSLPLLLS